MKFVLFKLAFCLAIIGSLFADDFEDFKKRTGRLYSNNNEETLRRSIFEENKKAIDKHNQEYEQGLQTYKMKVSKFSDMTEEELKKYVGRNTNNNNNSKPLDSEIKFLEASRVPSSVDWRTKGLVTPVKSQGKCGGCWAFSATGVLEGQYAKKFKKLVSFSEQQLIDCNKKNSGCKGGFDEIAFDYIHSYGIMAGSSYKYMEKEGKCRYNRKKVVARFTKHIVIPVSEEQLKRAVARVGPVSIAVDVNEKTKEFYNYAGGIFSTKKCKKDYDSLNHAILLVGYGTDPKTKLDYWIVKNTWGTDWGEDGYIRMRRNYGNMCGIATNGLYALIV